ncbi:MAG: hypothetical protein ACRDNK_04205 [Solirubrobacteraceae bacterium]
MEFKVTRALLEGIAYSIGCFIGLEAFAAWKRRGGSDADQPAARFSADRSGTVRDDAEQFGPVRSGRRHAKATEEEKASA